MMREVRDVIARGNVIDLAVGPIIGAAFTAIVSSLLTDLINPVVGLAVGGIAFPSMYLKVAGDVPDSASLAVAREAGAAVPACGAFGMAVLNSVIAALVVFALVKAVDRVRATATPDPDPAPGSAPDPGPSQIDLLIEMRDALTALRPGA